jgi:monoamine oxidase
LLREAEKIKGDISVAEFLARFERDPRTRPAAEWVRRLAEGFDAADPARASLKAIAQEWMGDALFESQGRPRGTHAILLRHMVRVLDPARVEVRLGSRVCGVRWSAGGVELDVEQTGSPRQLRARAALVTLPLGILQAKPDDPVAVHFDPPLDQKRAALSGLAMGPALKVLLRFSEAFWESMGDGRAAFFQAETSLPFPTFWTAFPERTRWLTAWRAGPGAARLSAESNAVIIRRAVESAAASFGNRAPVADLLEDARFHNWERDACSRGAYSYVLVGGLGARQALAQPIDATLFFAGEATDDKGEAGTVAGALATGERAAREVIAALP